MSFKSPIRKKHQVLDQLSNVIEELECRRLLSLTASEFYDPITVKGTQWTYVEQMDTGSVTFVDTVAGPATFNGQSATELDIHATGTDTSTGVTQTDDVSLYVAFTPAGLVTYGNVSGTDTTTYSPDDVIVPATLSAGQTYSYSDTMTVTSTASDGTSTDVSTDQQTFALASDTPANYSVPLGTFPSYTVNITDTTTDQAPGSTPNTQDSTDYLSDGLGFIGGDNTGNGIAPGQLTAFTTPSDQLTVTTQPTETPSQETLAPVVVSIEDSSGNVDTSSTTAVTVALISPTASAGVLTGTTTVNAVNGVAKFADLSVNKGGTYVLSVTDGNNDAPTQSKGFKVDGFALKVLTSLSYVSAGEPQTKTYSVEQVTLKGKKITTDNSTVVTLSVVGGTPTNFISGATTATMVNGKATFSGLSFNLLGKYRMQATDSSNDEPATFKTLTVGGLGIKFFHLAVHASVSVLFTYAAYVIDEQKRVDTSFTGDISVALNVLPSRVGTAADHNGAQLLGTTTVALVNGEAEFTLSDGDAVSDIGSYSLTASAQSTGEVPSSAVSMTTSSPIAVSPLKLVETVRPSRVVNVNSGINFQVQLRTEQGEAISSVEAVLAGIQVTAVTGSTGQTITDFTSPLVHLSPDTFTADFSDVMISVPGTYKLTVSGVAYYGIGNPSPNDEVTAVKIGPITVVAADN